MRRTPLPLLILSLLVAALLSACTGSVGAASGWPGISADKDSVYLAYNNQVFAINIGNGSERWRYPSDANAKISFYAKPVLTSDGQLLAGGYDYILYSLNPANGQEYWNFKTDNRLVGSPVVTADGIYLPSAGKSLYALDFKGKQKWIFETSGPNWAAPAVSADNKTLYLASQDHKLYAINTKDGTPAWQQPVDLGAASVGTPALSPDGVLYIGTFGSKIFAVDSKQGKILWSIPTNGWVWGGPSLKDGKLYFSDLKGNFYAMDGADGKILWKIQPDGPVVESPLLTDKTIYFTTEVASLYTVDYSGNILWTKTYNGKIYTSPVLTGETLIIATTGDNLLVALNPNGNQLWVYTPPKKK